jgi:hypothetical protein
MIPLWKIQREVMRIGAQIKNLPTAIVDLYELTQEPKLRRAHFAKLHERIALTDGQAPEIDRVAILLIYQSAGLAESTIILCQDLINNGFSPFVVTNSPLSDTDSTKLEAWCWKLMTRPNFGYDFGGYQDALFALRKIKTHLDYLIVMNDSVWLEFTPDLWVRLSEIDADVVGLIQEDKIFSTQTSEKHVDYRNIQSYLYSAFGKGADMIHPPKLDESQTEPLGILRFKFLPKSSKQPGKLSKSWGVAHYSPPPLYLIAA